MTRTFTTKFIVLTLAILLVAVATFAVAVVFAPAAMAEGEPVYLSGSLQFDRAAYVGDTYSVKALLWQSTDRRTWQTASLSDFDASVVFYDGDERLTAAPTAVGSYTVRLQLGSSCGDSLFNAAGTPLAADSSVCSLSYRVVDKGVSVVFAPDADIDYNSALDSYASIVSGTKVYYDGEDVTASATVGVENEAHAAVSVVTDPGQYHVAVSYGGKTYRSKFYVRRAVADIISLSSGVLYAGMHTTYNRGAMDPAAAKAAMLANRTAYYTPKFAGGLARANGQIADAYRSSVAVSYWQGSRRLDSVPTSAGDYVCRVQVLSDISAFGLAAGDFVDLPYTIKPAPYTVVWNRAVDAATGAMYVVADSNGVSVRASRFVLTADSSRYLDLSVGAATYYDADGNQLSAESVAAGLTALGRYTVYYEIDLSHAGGNRITGKDYFGEEDQSFVIDASNCGIECTFEIIGAYQVSGVRGLYYNTQSEYAKEYVRTHSDAFALDNLSPVVRYNSIAADNYTVDYTFEGSSTFADGDPVTLGNIKTKKAVGHYDAVITFGLWQGVNAGGQTVTVTTAGETYHFSFDVAAVPQSGLSVVADDSAEAMTAVSKLVDNLGLSAAEVDVSYFKLQNGLYTSISASSLAAEVGTYCAYVQANAGAYSGQSFVLSITKQSTATADSIVLDVLGLANNAADYTGTAFTAVVDFGDQTVADGLSYSLYYERQAGANWSVCGYPTAPGTYRAVLRFNEPCEAFSVAYGATVYNQFVIRELPLSVSATFADDVYDGTQKEVDLVFYVNGKPLSADVVADFDYTVYYAKSPDVNYTTDRPLHAGLYAVGLVFNAGDYSRFGYTATTMTPGEIYAAYAGYAGYMLRGDATVTLHAALLDTVVSIPVGYRAMYAGDEVTPAYAFYLGNEQKSDLESLTANIQAQTRLTKYEDYFYTYFAVDSSRTAFGSNIKSEDVAPIETGRYDRLLTIKDAYIEDVAFGRVAVVYDGAQEGVTYDAGATVVAGSSSKLNTFYTVNALPVTISALESAFRLSGDAYVAYYGESHLRSVTDLVFYTYDRNGNRVALTSPDLSEYVSMRYYTRLSGNTSLGHETTAGADGLFDKGSYTLRITFAAPADSATALTYSHYALTGGADTATEGLLQGGCYLDVLFDVLQADTVRVVFDARFDSYSYDGSAKQFDVRFLSGEDDVSADFVEGVDYRLTYGDSLTSDAVGQPDVDTAYNVKVTFQTNSYHYYVEQYLGEYSDADENIRYIRAGSTVTFNFVVTRIRYLSWAWNNAEGNTSFYYDGTWRTVSVDFVSATTYNAHAPAVSLVRGTDYDVWYYAKDGATYAKLREAPVLPGSYLAEIVFLRDLTDYRYLYDSTGLVVYGYHTADANYVMGSAVGSEHYYFGSSLATTGVVLSGEGRYFEYTVARPTLMVEGLTAQNKVFDNTSAASVSPVYRLAAVDGASIVASDVQALRNLLNGNFVGRFATVGVGEGASVYFGLQLGEGAVVTMPHVSLVADLSTTGVAYVLRQLSELTTADLSDEVAAKVIAAIALFEALQQKYELYFADVQANITKGSVTVLANSYARYYDPEFDDDGVLTYGLSNEDLAKLQAFLPSVRAAEDAFVGNLTRENAEVNDINESGYLIIAGDDFGFVSTPFALSDGTYATLADLFSIRISRAMYYINPCPLVVGVADNRVTIVYGDADPVVNYTVVAGTLRDGDELVYVGTLREQRQIVKDIDDVGTYAILYNQVRVHRFGLDVTANYRLSFRAAEFVITPLEVILTPEFGRSVYYERDAFEPTAVNVSKRVGASVVGFDDLQSRFGAHLSYTFGRVETDSTDPSVYKAYNVTLGSIKMLDDEDNDVSQNYTFVLGVNTRQFVVRKYTINLSIEGESPVKYYGDPDPYVQLHDYRNSLSSLGFTVSADSMLSREQGEDMGIYRYLPTNVDGAIHILDGDGEDVTKYCNITVYEGSRQLSDFVLNINPLRVVVTVRSETINRTGRSILPEIIYLTSDGKSVSSALTARMKTKFGIPADWTPVEGVNTITPVVVSAPESDDNFAYVPTPGTVNVVFPNNVIAVSAINQDDAIASANRYAFVGGVLYRTLQIYAANTLDGADPDHLITISLPVTEALYGEDVYIIAVRKNGSYSVREATVSGSEITITDDQFYYVLAAQPEYWPYYIVAGLAALVLVAVVVVLLRSKSRVKVRGKKVRPVKEKKVKEKPAKPVAPTVVAPTAGADEYGVPELDTAQAEASVVPTDAQPVADDVSAPVGKPKAKKEKKQKVEKPKQQKPKAPKGKPAAPTMGYMPGMAKPSATPSAVVTPQIEGDTLPLPDADDEILPGDEIVPGGASSDVAAPLAPVADVDDDEIIISGSSRRFDDGDDSGVN